MSCYAKVWIPDDSGGHWEMREAPCPMDFIILEGEFKDAKGNPKSSTNNDDDDGLAGFIKLALIFIGAFYGGTILVDLATGFGKNGPGTPGFIDPNIDAFRNQCPPISGPCDVDEQNAIKSAWASVMERLLKPKFGELINYVKGCNAAIDKMLACLSSLPYSNFTWGPASNTLKITCDSSSAAMKLLGGAYSNNEIKLNIKNINGNLKNNPNLLESTILHELIHFCGADSELDAKWLENFFYGCFAGTPCPEYGISINVDKSGNKGVMSDALLAICCASKKTWAKWHGVDPARNQGNFVYSRNLIWDYSTGELTILCDFPQGRTLSIDDRFNSLKEDYVLSSADLAACLNVSLTVPDCYP